jgi:hypothetical protein
MPLALETPVFVRTKTMKSSAWEPLVTQSLVPSTTKSPPSRTAAQRSAAASEPHTASERE